MPNLSFSIPRKSQKITSIQPTSIVQYAELIGNLPQRKKYADRVPDVNSNEYYGQAFTSTKERIKAVGLYLKADFRSIGERRSGLLVLKLYSWGTYGDFTTLTAMTMPLSGKPAEVEVAIEDIQNLNETVFEFEEQIPLNIADDYFFTITQVEGFNDKKPIYIGSSGENYGSVQGDFWIWDINTPAQSRRMNPATDFVFQAYVSITELSVEIVGTGGGNLTGIQDALAIAEGAFTPQVGFGVIDYTKPFQMHGNALIDPSTVYGDAPSKVNGTVITTPYAHPGFSDSSDLLVEMKTVTTPVFVGGGADVMTAYQDFTGLKDLIFLVTISGVSPNLINWTARDSAGTIVLQQTNVAVPLGGGDVTLTSGVRINFSTDVGLVLGDAWAFMATNWDFAIVRTATDRIRMDWGDASDTLDCGSSFRLMEEADAIMIPEYVSQFAFRKHVAGDADPTISITLWRTVK